jgi:hypothetical protein
LKSGEERVFRQPHMRGGAHDPMPTAELESKFVDNAVHGGWTSAMAERFIHRSHRLFSEPTLNLEELRS